MSQSIRSELLLNALVLSSKYKDHNYLAIFFQHGHCVIPAPAVFFTVTANI